MSRHRLPRRKGHGSLKGTMMRHGYSQLFHFATGFSGLLAPVASAVNAKAGRTLAGRKGLMAEIKGGLTLDPSKPTAWFHASSLGEFAIARPLIERLQPDHNIVITFFSPTGYEHIKPKAHLYPNVFYLPWDTRGQARKFLDAVKPAFAVFMVSEIWHNFMVELHERHIPAYLVSALMRPGGALSRWYGSLYLDSLLRFSAIFTLNDESAALMRKHGIATALSLGNPLFDNALAQSRLPYSNEIVERFAAGRPMLVAGSIHLDDDLDLVARGVPPAVKKILVVPHETDGPSIARLRDTFVSEALVYSECGAATDLESARVLIIDYVGDLARLYRYGDWAYVGGGFTRYLHSVLEPAVYGIPVAFGPVNTRKITPSEMIREGIGRRLHTPEDMRQWLEAHPAGSAQTQEIREKARRYFDRNAGATDRILRHITKDTI